MSLNLKEIVGNIFHTDKKEKEQKRRTREDLQQKFNNVVAFGNARNTSVDSVNPFLKNNGELVNPNLNYQALLNNPNIAQRAKNYITQATGLTQTEVKQPVTEKVKDIYGPTMPTVADTDKLGDMDIITELPKLTKSQIEAIIGKHYKNSTVISPEDAQAIFNAQANSGVSALVTLGIGALESGWGTSNIAKKTRNLWGYGATNDNPENNAHKYTTIEDAALRYSNSLKKDYYNGYGAKSINSIGTGNNPAGKGYAYNNDGSISTTWSPNVTSIMKTLYNTAQTVK